MAFAAFLEELDLAIPQFDAVLRFETAALQTRVDNLTRVVEFDYDPFPMLLALADGHLPTEYSQVGHYEIEITGDGRDS